MISPRSYMPAPVTRPLDTSDALWDFTSILIAPRSLIRSVYLSILYVLACAPGSCRGVFGSMLIPFIVPQTVQFFLAP